MDSFEFVEFDEDDIVRSDLVKEYIITRNKLGLDWAS
jgi:phosphate starvation-inducible protein PhoH